MPGNPHSSVRGQKATGVGPSFLQFGEDPQGVFQAKKAATTQKTNETLRKHLDFEAQKDAGETDAVVVMQTFDKLDRNYDDQLSRSEFLAGALQGASNPTSRDSLVGIFNTMDRDGNGSISRSEFVTAASEAPGSQKMLGLNPAFRLADADGDAFLSQEEFFYIARQFYPLEWQNSQALFTKLKGGMKDVNFSKFNNPSMLHVALLF